MISTRQPTVTSPNATLTRDALGNFYGTTSEDGAHGNGTIFELAANGSFNILHAFGSTEGAESVGRLLLHGTNLYGVTIEGGGGTGSIFEFALGGAFTTLQAMHAGEGMGGGVARDRKGNLYGAYFGDGNGYVYKLSPDGTVSPLYTFTGGADGRFPVGDMLLSNRKHELYGSTRQGRRQRRQRNGLQARSQGEFHPPAWLFGSAARWDRAVRRLAQKQGKAVWHRLQGREPRYGHRFRRVDE